MRLLILGLSNLLFFFFSECLGYSGSLCRGWVENVDQFGECCHLITEQLHFHFSLSCIGEGNGNPLQCSCLENPRDAGAWWAAIYGVGQSRTRLKRLSSSSSSHLINIKCSDQWTEGVFPFNYILNFFQQCFVVFRV